MTTKARLVIVGAGIVGSSIAYNLTKLGWKDILVIDKGPLYFNDGSSSHAPGGVNPVSTNEVMLKIAKESFDLYSSLPQWGTERKPFNNVGGLDVARTSHRMYELKRLHTIAKSFGVETELIGPEEIPDHFPLMRPDEFVGGILTPSKVYVSGAHASGSLGTMCEASGGAKFVGYTRVTDFVIKGDRITGVKTNNPEMAEIECEQVLLCANIWSPAIADKVGINIPLMSAEHQYVWTEPIAEMAHVSDKSNLDNEIIYPGVRDLDGGVYYRHYWDQVGIGSYHHKPIIVDPRNLGDAAEHDFTEDDWKDAWEMCQKSLPSLRGKSLDKKFNGMFSFSADGSPICGETPLKGFWVAAAVWITHAGGIGRLMAEWMTYGEAWVDTRGVNVNRFLGYQQTKRYINEMCAKAYVEVHDVTHPAQPASKPRNVRITPFHHHYESLKAVWNPTAGLELPYWLEENQHLLEKYDAQVPDRTGWESLYWSRIQGAEHLAVRDSVGMFDVSGIATIEIKGKGALDYVNYVCSNQMDVPVGEVVYTLLCTPSGGIKRDVPVARVGKDRFWMFTGNASLPQELFWLNSYLPEDGTVTINDLSQSQMGIGLFGPNARKVLEKVTNTDVSNEAFPFYTCKQIEVDYATPFAMRISYVGEMGWELHLPTDQAGAVRDKIWEAGREFGITMAGTGALRSMRVEKGYRLWGADIDTKTNPYESGMGWMVKLDKGDFVGRDALVKLKAAPLTRKLVTITSDDPSAVVTGNEPIFLNGELVGRVTSGNYGYSVGKYVAFGYVDIAHAKRGTQLEVEYLAERYPFKIERATLFDRKNARLTG
ncbi:MAG: GcvT family protein [Candidatus Promineifilaceae bacterium]